MDRHASTIGANRRARPEWIYNDGMVKSDLEAWLLRDIRAVGLPEPIPEHRFHPKRMWRFDFCWIDQMVAVEVEGGVYMRGRHLRPAGYTEDCRKYNEAALLGWVVIRVTSGMIESGEAISFIERAVKKV